MNSDLTTDLATNIEPIYASLSTGLAIGIPAIGVSDRPVWLGVECGYGSDSRQEQTGGG